MKDRVFSRRVITIALSFLPIFALAAESVSTLKISGPALPAVVRTTDEAQRVQYYDKFLKDTGFPDLPAAIAKTLESPQAQNLEKMNRDTLEANWHRLQIVNFARDLAVELLAKLTPTLGEPVSAAKTAELAARLMSQKRIAIPDAFPDAIRNIRNYDQRVAAKDQFLRGAIEKNIIRMQEQMLSDSLHTIYGKAKIDAILNGSNEVEKNNLKTYIQRLDGLIHHYVSALYFDHEMGLGHWIGEAVALGLVHTSRLSKDPETKKFEALLNNRAYVHGEYLSDFVSDVLTFEDTEGKRHQIKVGQADTITEMYSLAWSSRISAAGVRPNILNRWKAHKDKLLQDFAFAAVTADETSSAWKAIDGKDLSLLDKVRLTLAMTEEGNVGASHAGMATVFKNEQSGVAITRAIDMYAFGPMPYGGARFIPTKTVFATPGVFANFGVASLDPEKTLDYLQNLTRKNGYQPVFKVSDIYRPNEKGELIKAEGETFNWTPRITEEQQKEFLKVDKRDAKKWYETVLAPNLAAEMLRYITDYGMAFRTFGKDAPNKMACYCTEGVNIAGFRETGHNLQSHPDKVFFLGRVAKFVYPKLKKQKIFAEDPIAPSFMAWDPKTTDDTIHYRIRGLLESWMEQIQAPRTDFDPGLTAMISPMVNRQLKYTKTQGGQLTYSPESYLNAVEVSVVTNPEKPHRTTAVPRVHPMGVSTSEAPVLLYNPEPPAKAKAPLVSDEDLRLKRSLHGTYLMAAKYSSESPAAAFILAELAPRLTDENTMHLLQVFTAKMMALKPINPPRLLPPEVIAVPEKEREAAIAKYVAKFTSQQIESQTRQILSDAAGILYGKDVVARAARHPTLLDAPAIRQRLNELYLLLGAEVRKMYVDPAAADARILGVNLALGVTIQAMKSESPKNISSLLEALKPYGLEWGDFFEAPLNLQQLGKNIKVGDFSLLKPRLNPGERLRNRLSQPKEGRKPRLLELAQLKYSSYAEVQPELTRSLDTIFNQNPVFATAKFTVHERHELVVRTVKEYMEPMNQEQLGNNGDIRSSGFLRANPIPPTAPKYPLTCPGLFL